MCIELLAGERQKGETSKATQACNDYLRAGPARSVAALHRQYLETPENARPTASYDTLRRWSEKHDWPQRAAEYDQRIEAEKDARAGEIMQSGLALAHERVVKLRGLAQFLEQQLYEQDESGRYVNLWLKDVKIIGYGKNAEMVTMRRFNQALVSEYRGSLDDIAKETGGRVRKVAPTDPTGEQGWDAFAGIRDELIDRLNRIASAE